MSYLPDGDVALEFDGPYHFIITDGGEGGDPSDVCGTSTRTLSTKLRDNFLARRLRKILSVPWFEWAKLHEQGAGEKQVYVAAKLKVVGVSIPTFA